MFTRSYTYTEMLAIYLMNSFKRQPKVTEILEFEDSPSNLVG